MWESLVALVLGVSACALLSTLHIVLYEFVEWPRSGPQDLVVLAVSLLVGGTFIVRMNASPLARLLVGVLYLAAATASALVLGLLAVCHLFGDCL